MANLPDGKRLLVLSVTSGIGDTIMAIPMLRLLHQKMPEANITLGVLAEGARQFHIQEAPITTELHVLDQSNRVFRAECWN